MTRRERGYISLLEERCGVLRARINAGQHGLNYIHNWQQELAAIDWAIQTLKEVTERDYE